MMDKDCSISLSVEDCSFCVIFSLISICWMLRYLQVTLIVSYKLIPNLFVTIHFFQGCQKKETNPTLLFVNCVCLHSLL